MKTGRRKKKEPAIKFERSCGNVFADLGLPDADELLAKATIISNIHGVINEHHLTIEAAARLIGVSTHDLDQLLRGDLDRYPKSELKRLLGIMKTSFNGRK